jgi:peptide/nickel transport system ATP-binding protein
MGKLLEVNNLSISFTQYVQGLNRHDLKVISDLSLDIEESEIVAVLGSSGSGKSLLAHTILGILPYNAHVTGEVKYKGEVLDQDKKEKIRGKEICLIPQSVNFLDPLMKVSQQAVGECKDDDERKEKKLKQREVFAKYGLDESVDDLYPFELSGGMARKVLLSTALLNDPDLLIADEPTPGLDSKSVEETIQDIRKLKEQGKGVLLITHEIDVALKTADRIAIFYSGYVIEINKVENFLNSENLLHPYTKALVDALPHNGFKLTEGVQPLEEVLGCPYYENCPISSDKCANNKPELIEHNGAMIRCFNFNKAVSEDSVSEDSVSEDSISEDVADEVVSEEVADEVVSEEVVDEVVSEEVVEEPITEEIAEEVNDEEANDGA